MPRNDLKFNKRGFARYGEGSCSHGIGWRVLESSMADAPHCWLFTTGVLRGVGSVQERTQRGALHLSVEQASELISHLQTTGKVTLNLRLLSGII